MATDPNGCELLVGLPDVTVREVTDPSPATQMIVEIETTLTGPVACGDCGTQATIKDRASVCLVGLPAFGWATRLRWIKRRWCCPSRDARPGRGPNSSRGSARRGCG